MTRKRRLFWSLLAWLATSLVIGSLLLLISIHIQYGSFAVPDPSPTPEATTTSGAALPSSPVGLAFLALVIGFSVYLRQVASGADDKRNTIMKGDMLLYPINGPYTGQKLDALNQTHENLTVIAPFLIWLALLATVRVLLDGIGRFGFRVFERHVLFIRVADFALLEWLVLTFMALAWFHFKASRADEKLRTSALAHHRAHKDEQQRVVEQIRILRGLLNDIDKAKRPDGKNISDVADVVLWLKEEIRSLQQGLS